MKLQRITLTAFRILLLSLVTIAFATTNVVVAIDTYVAVDGDVDADGSLSNPFGSLPEAVQAVRGLREAGINEPAMIYLREGRHQLDRTLVLGLGNGSPKLPSNVTLPQHGAGETTEPAFLTFAAFPNEHPVVSGGVPVTGWKRLDWEIMPPERTNETTRTSKKLPRRVAMSMLVELGPGMTTLWGILIRP